MDQMASAHPFLGAASWGAKVDSVMHYLVDRESGQDAPVKKRPTVRSADHAEKYRQQGWQPRAQREDRAGVTMMDLMERAREGREPMAHPAVDRVLKESPGEESRAEESEESDDKNRPEHSNIVRRRRSGAQPVPHRSASMRDATVGGTPRRGYRLLSDAFLIYWLAGSSFSSSGTRSLNSAGQRWLATRRLNLSHPLSSKAL
jgi:hypothetical protein